MKAEWWPAMGWAVGPIAAAGFSGQMLRRLAAKDSDQRQLARVVQLCVKEKQEEEEDGKEKNEAIVEEEEWVSALFKEVIWT